MVKTDKTVASKATPVKAASVSDPTKVSPVKKPNKITRTIASPDSKEEKAKSKTIVVRVAQTKMLGTAIVTTSKLNNADEDGFNYPLAKSINLGEPWAIENSFFYTGKIRMSPTSDTPRSNAQTGYLRRSFVRLDNSATTFPEPDELRLIAEEVCKVSILKTFWYYSKTIFELTLF